MLPKIHWQELREYVVDSDGGKPDTERFIALMCEYRDEGSMSDYWFYTEESHDGLCWDQWNNEYRYPESVGPNPGQIDWDGLPL